MENVAVAARPQVGFFPFSRIFLVFVSVSLSLSLLCLFAVSPLELIYTFLGQICFFSSLRLATRVFFAPISLVSAVSIISISYFFIYEVVDVDIFKFSVNRVG